MNPAVARAVESALGSACARAVPVSGGDINEAYRVSLADGRTVFVKTNERADPAMFPAEARGLDWLSRAGALRVPRVLAASRGGTPQFLALEYLASARPVADFDERLGRGLAALHRFGAPGFGLDHDNFIGRLPQSNAATTTWAEFYRERRLLPQLERAADRGLASAELKKGFERLFARMEDVVGPPEPPSRLHGDLWGGNLHIDERGEPCIIDPAAYGGHREIDLAMMRLFGGFSEGTFAAYDEAFPLADGHEERVSLYQLYPLMVHVNLFGGSYAASALRALRGYV
jgi:fructosamine-3-kinase